nr:MAG TPA: hypothetical protein [Caudoviricetes sp.]
MRKGVLMASFLFYSIYLYCIGFCLCYDYVKSRYVFCISVSPTFSRLNCYSCIKKQLDLPLLYI